MTYKKGDVLKNNSNNAFRLILGGNEGLYDLSNDWLGLEEEYSRTDDDGLREDQKYETTFTEAELDAYFTIVTPEEAGIPAEQWVPDDGDIFFVGAVHCSGKADFMMYTWNNDETDRNCLAIGNVHKRKEEAIAWAKKRYNV